MAGKRRSIAKRKTGSITKAKGYIKITKSPRGLAVYCHLCKINLINNEEFRLHIMKKHRPRSKLYQGDTDTSSDSDMELPAKPTQSNNAYLDNDEKCDPLPRNTEYNISETAAFPQSSSALTKSKKNIQNLLQTSCNELEGNKPPEGEKPAPPKLSYNAFNSSVFPAQNLVGNNPQVIFHNNQLQIVNPFFPQPLLNGFIGGNWPSIQPVPSQSNLIVTPEPAFSLNVKNITEWYNKWKEMSSPFKDPLPKRYLKKIQIVYRTIFDNLHLMGNLAQPDKQAILKVFQEMKEILEKSVECIGQSL